MKGTRLEVLSDRALLKMKIRGECYHQMVQSPGNEDVAICDICDFIFFDGWYCSDSPDHTCHYKSAHDPLIGRRFVESINGVRIILPEDYSEWEHENYDCCIFCGQPNERK